MHPEPNMRDLLGAFDGAARERSGITRRNNRPNRAVHAMPDAHIRRAGLHVEVIANREREMREPVNIPGSKFPWPGVIGIVIPFGQTGLDTVPAN